MTLKKSKDSHDPWHEIPETYEGQLEPNYFCRGWNAKRKKYCSARAGSGTDHLGEGRCRHHRGNASVKSGRYSTITTRPRLKELLERFEADEDPLDLSREVTLLRALMVDLAERWDEMMEGNARWHASFQDNYLNALGTWLREVKQKSEPEILALHSALVGAVDDLVELMGMDEGIDRRLGHAKKRLERALARGEAKIYELPSAPDPLTFVNKPRQQLDITSIAGLTDKVGKMVERIEKQRQEGTIRLETLDRVLEQLGVEVVKAVQQHVSDADTRAALLRDIEEQWGTIRLEPTAARPGAPQGARELN
jgi:hypothetical protein